MSDKEEYSDTDNAKGSDAKSRIPLILSIISICLTVLCLICCIVCLVLVTRDNDEPATAVTTTKDVQYVMYVGTNDKDTYEPKYPNETAKNMVDAICLKYFDGYTLQEATGSWIDETDQITHEYTIVCYFDAPDVATLYKAADEIIEVLNQNTVLIESSEISMEYYDGKKASVRKNHRPRILRQ